MSRLHAIVDIAVPAVAIAAAAVADRFDSQDRASWLVLVGAVGLAWYLPAAFSARKRSRPADWERLPLWLWAGLSALVWLP